MYNPYPQYNPNLYQQNNPFQNQNQAQLLPKYEVIKVSGRGGAEAFQMGPNSSMLLLDETAPIVWLKTTDGGGYPTLTPYSITPYQPKPEVNVESLVQRIERLEALINESDSASIRKSTRKSTAESN